MKKLLTMAALLGATAWSFGQGNVTFANSAATLISTNGVHGGAALGPTSPTLGGFVYALFVAPSTVNSVTGATDPNWQTVGGYATNTAAASGGRLAGGQPTLPAPYASGSTANFLIRAWSTTVGGADWTTVGLSPLWAGTPGAQGQFLYTSPIRQIIIGGGPNPVPPTFGADVTSTFQGFTLDQVSTVPEPSSLALAGLGAAALLIFRRRK